MIIIKEYSIDEVDLNSARTLSKDLCEKYKIIPIKEDKSSVTVITFQEKSIPDYIKFLYEKEIIVELVSESNYEHIKKIIYGEEKRSLDETIIYSAIDQKSSDIHFEPSEYVVGVRFRINGVLSLMYKIDTEEFSRLCSKIKIKANMDIAEKRRPQDGKIIIRYNNLKYDLRVSIVPVVFGEKIVIRILYCDNFDYRLEELGFEEEKVKLIRKISSLNNGLVIINGPTGSGKSTTLYTILKELDCNRLNITTLEDPVEVYLPNINQISLNKNFGLNFQNGLRSILRQDPDIIMVGEIRDEETAKIAVRASITGHKVYSTIHAKSPREVYLRLENMGVKNYLLNESIIGIISQRLVKILCTKCKRSDEKIKYKNHLIYTSNGCKYCNYSGYESQKVISTVYYLDKGLKNTINKIYEDSSFLDNFNMKKDLENLLIKGEIPYKDYISFIEGEMIDDI